MHIYRTNFNWTDTMRLPIRRVLTLTAAVGVVGANSLVLSPIAASVAQSFENVSAPDVLTASAGFGLGTAVSALFLAPQADRIGADRALVAALVCLAIGLASSTVAPTLVFLILAQIVAGFAAGVALPAAYSLAAQIAPPGAEARTIGLVLTGWTLSLVAGVSSAALIAEYIHWRAVYALFTGLALICSGLIHFQDFGPRLVSETRSPFAAIKVPGIITGLLIATAFMLAFYGLYSFVGPHLTQSLGLTTAAAGAISLSYGIGFGVAVFADGLLDHAGTHKATKPVFAAITVLYCCLALVSSNYILLISVAFFWGIAQHFGLNLIVARLSALDPTKRGAIMGLNSATTYLCVFGGALGFRPIYTTVGFAGCAMASAIIVAMAVALLWMQDRRSRPPVTVG
jgi:DHA1 family inner membrane transport protein